MNELEWHSRFLRLAEHVASWSPDPHKKCGAAIVRRDGSVASVGCNRFPRGMPANRELFENRVEKYPRMIHAEIDALHNLREQPSDCSIYIWPLLSCDRCAVEIIHKGIRRVLTPFVNTYGTKWDEPIARARRYYTECGVRFHEFSQQEMLEMAAPQNRPETQSTEK